MNIKQLIDEDFVNYKVPSMFIGFPTCDFKCEKECEQRVCQNSVLAKSPIIDISIDEIITRYTNNFISEAIVIGGLEPFDSFDDLVMFIERLRKYTSDDVVIYSGYYESEIHDYVEKLKKSENIVIKYGRFIPNQKSHYDDILGVNLMSDNQYAERIS